MPRKSLHDQIAQIAYGLFIQSGCIHGYDLDHWLEAERLILSKQKPKLKKKDKISEPGKTESAKKAKKTTIKKTAEKELMNFSKKKSPPKK